jgi:hypothetical protein
MSQNPTIAQQTFAALGAFAITAALLFGSFAPPATDAAQGIATTEVLA